MNLIGRGQLVKYKQNSFPFQKNYFEYGIEFYYTWNGNMWWQRNIRMRNFIKDPLVAKIKSTRTI